MKKGKWFADGMSVLLDEGAGNVWPAASAVHSRESSLKAGHQRAGGLRRPLMGSGASGRGITKLELGDEERAPLAGRG